MMKTVFTNDLVRSLARAHRKHQAHYRQALSEILAEITHELTYGHRVTLIGFGTFYTREQPAGKVTSVRTGRNVAVSARRVAAFRVGELLKRAVRQKPAGRPRKGVATAVTSRLGSCFKASRPRPATTKPRSTASRAWR